MDEILFRQFQQVESRHWWFTARRDILLAVLRRELPVGSRFLDVGCGTGFLLAGAREFLDVAGVDVSPIGLRMCRELGVTQVSEGSAVDMSRVGERAFDGAGLFDVIEHLDDDVGALRNVRAVLRPGGVVVVTVPAFMFLWSAHDDLNEHRRRYTRSQLGRVLTEAGFEVRKLTYFNSWLFPLAAVSRILGRLLPPRRTAGLTVPPGPVNAMLRRVFTAERERVLAATADGGLPVGLSVLAVGRRP